MGKISIKKGDGLQTTTQGALALAYRYLLYQPVGNLLLPLQRAGWLQSLHHLLGDQRTDNRSGVEAILLRAKERFSQARPRIISDNRP